MKIAPLQKFTRLFAGFLASVFVVVILLKIFTSFILAALGGLLINGLASYLILQKSRTSTNGEALKYLAYGAMLGTALITLGSLLLWLMVESAFSGIAD
ncbi:hypothetical protein KC725_04305 [Candidatus Peregrinibacteria bacterium]|nr:hypothetical protein [Candidatus Peregrinibacteria bacterium]